MPFIMPSFVTYINFLMDAVVVALKAPLTKCCLQDFGKLVIKSIKDLLVCRPIISALNFEAE